MKKSKSALLVTYAFAAGLRRYSIPIVAAEALAVIFAAAGPLVQKYMIDGTAFTLNWKVFYAAALLAVLMGGQFVLRGLGRFMRGLLGVEVRKNLKSTIFRHLLALPEDFLRSRGAGYFFNRIQHDINEISSFVSGNALLLFSETLKLILSMLICFYLDWRCGVLLIPFLLLQIFCCYLFRQRQYMLSRKLLECTAVERHVMQEFLASHRTLKSHAAEVNAGERIDSGLSRWGDLMRSRLKNENIFLACVQLPVWFCGGIILVSGLYMVMLKQTTLGEVWALLLLMNMVFAPARSLGAIFIHKQTAEAAWERLMELRQQEVEDDVEESGRINLAGDIIFKKICFAYDNKRDILKNLDLCVPWRSGVFLCGANGSGKSTLFSLLLRLYKPQAGSISVNGRDIVEYPLSSYRERIGYIGQYPEFIDGTVRENLLLGRKNISDEKIMELFRQLECADLIERQAEKLDYRVAERGENFSGGERLRLVLVRELLRDTDWILFDEAAANLDLAGRQNFYALLQKLPGDKGVIAIVHDVPENSNWPVLNLSELQNNNTI